MGRYFLSSCADTDMSAIWQHISADNLSAADCMIDRFTAEFERLAQFPELGERYEHPSGEFRRVVVAPYVVFYQITGDEVDIVRLLHGARRWEDLL